MTKWHGGKGSSYRQVDRSKFDSNWDNIFKKGNIDEEETERCLSGGVDESQHTVEQQPNSSSD